MVFYIAVFDPTVSAVTGGDQMPKAKRRQSGLTEIDTLFESCKLSTHFLIDHAHRAA